MTGMFRPTDPLVFAIGVEDTFIPQTRPGERPLDEYELMQHYQLWSEDLGRIHEAGAGAARWGIPWYRINPAPDVWDFAWLDRVIDRFEELGIDLIVDLMHYGTPLWLTDEFANPRYPEAVAEYARRVAERYRGRIRAYTPLNEPMLNIMYCGEFGHWPPYLTGDDGFVTVLRAIARGIVLTQQAVAEADPDATFVHVEASFRFAGEVEHFADEVDHLRARAFLVEDLVTGRVGADHPLIPWLLEHGLADADLEWFRTNTAPPDVMGVNYYPQHSTELFERDRVHSGGPGDLRPRHNAWTDGLAELLRSWAERYGVPVMLTETSFTGTVDERLTWLDASVALVHELRDEGLPLVGYTWWCITDMIEWTYRQGDQPPMAYRLRMGLWDLVEDHAGVLQRVKNPVADRFRAHALAAPTGAPAPTGDRPTRSATN